MSRPQQAARTNSKIATSTIDSDNNIAAQAGAPADTENLQVFATEKELAELAAEWPGLRLWISAIRFS